MIRKLLQVGEGEWTIELPWELIKKLLTITAEPMWLVNGWLKSNWESPTKWCS